MGDLVRHLFLHQVVTEITNTSISTGFTKLLKPNFVTNLSAVLMFRADRPTLLALVLLTYETMQVAFRRWSFPDGLE